MPNPVAQLDAQAPDPQATPAPMEQLIAELKAQPLPQTIDTPANPMTRGNVEQFWEEGYTIIRNVFHSHEVDQMASALDRWKFTGNLLGRTWRKQNTVIWVDNTHQEGTDSPETVVRGMQWPTYYDAVLDHYRTDPRMLMILEPLIGVNIKQIINQVHWKKPGSRVTWPLHRDVRSRQPVSAFRDLFQSWVQTGIAIDPHRAENGAMKVVPGSHRDFEADPMNQDLYNVPHYSDDPRTRDIVLNPGDIALWNAYTVHGGGFNTTEFQDRRLYINGFVKADKCERGEWAFRDGRTCHLHGKQSLIQFKEIDTIAEAFYASDHGRQEKITD